MTRDNLTSGLGKYKAKDSTIWREDQKSAGAIPSGPGGRIVDLGWLEVDGSKVSGVEPVYVACEQHNLTIGWILEQQADDANVGSVREVSECAESVTEVAVVSEIDGDGFRNQNSGEAVDLHLEGTVGRALASRYDGSVKAPVAQSTTGYGDGVGIGGAG